MKVTEIEQFSKDKKKELRMKTDKIKETARQRNQDKHGKERNKVLMELYRYDERYCTI